jgi:hypothetical protein
MKCNKTLGKWCKNKHGASKIIDTLETYQRFRSSYNEDLIAPIIDTLETYQRFRSSYNEDLIVLTF